MWKKFQTYWNVLSIGLIFGLGVAGAVTHYSNIYHAKLFNSTLNGAVANAPVVTDANGELTAASAGSGNGVTGDTVKGYITCGSLGAGVTTGSYGHTFTAIPNLIVTGVGATAWLSSASTTGFTVGETGSIQVEWCAYGPY